MSSDIVETASETTKAYHFYTHSHSHLSSDKNIAYEAVLIEKVS